MCPQDYKLHENSGYVWYCLTLYAPHLIQCLAQVGPQKISVEWVEVFCWVLNVDKKVTTSIIVDAKKMKYLNISQQMVFSEAGRKGKT